MQRRLFFWELAGFLFTVAAGTLGHFLYEWSGGSRIVATFAAVNESTWEHMKLVFFPILLFTLFQLLFQRRRHSNFLAVRALSALVGTALVPVLFYTYRGAWGQDEMWVNIAVFVVCALAAFFLDWRLTRRGVLSSGWMQIAGAAALCAVTAAFVYLTFRPAAIALFQDPVTLRYGLPLRPAA